MAIRFDNPDDSIKVVAVPSFSSFTVCYWLLLVTGSGGTQITFYCNNNGSDTQWIGLTLDSANKPFIDTSAGTGASGSTLSTGTWYHLALIKNGTGFTLYLNGLQDTTATLSVTTSAIDTIYGANAFSGFANEGSLDCDCRIFDYKIWSGVALSQAEIQAEMHVVQPRRMDGLWLWSPLISATELTDFSGNGRNWTVTDGTITSEDSPPVSWGALLETPFNASAATLSGTILAATDEADIRAGGKTIILTLGATTWIP